MQTTVHFVHLPSQFRLVLTKRQLHSEQHQKSNNFNKHPLYNQLKIVFPDDASIIQFCYFII